MTESTETVARPPVPQFYREVTGQKYGGQYWGESSYEIFLDATGERHSRVIEVRLGDSYGSDNVFSRTLDRSEATMLAVLFQDPTEPPPVRSVPNLTRELLWELGDDTSDNVTLRAGLLTELGAWLNYALENEKWDYAENGDEWEY